MISESDAVRLGLRALVESGRGDHDVSEIRHDAGEHRWTISFRPQLGGGQTADVIDGGPIVLVNSRSGEAQIVDMMSPPVDV